MLCVVNLMIGSAARSDEAFDYQLNRDEAKAAVQCFRERDLYRSAAGTMAQNQCGTLKVWQTVPGQIGIVILTLFVGYEIGKHSK